MAESILPSRGIFTQALINAKARQGKREAKQQGYCGVVTNSYDLARILDVPRRSLNPEDVVDLTPLFRKEGGTMVLRPIQNAALLEANLANGLFAPIPCGGGKTVISLLLPEAMDSERAVLLVPPQLRDQLAREIDEVYGPHFNLPMHRIVRILAYSELSLAKNSEILDELEPDLIIADECHSIRRASSSRTKRFTRYMRENPHCRLAAMSGTITSRSILDYAHLIEMCLRKNSPLPTHYNELKDWSGAIDVETDRPMAPGELMRLCAPGENHRQGYRRRMIETQGVVTSKDNDIGTGLYIGPVTTTVPAPVVEALQEARSTWAYADEEFSTPLELSRFCSQVASGFYYRWVWPDGQPDVEWLEARKAWKRAVREKLKYALPGLDSELLLANAAERWRQLRFEDKKPKKEDAKLWECEEWIEWKAVKGRYNPTPPTEAVWVSDFFVNDIATRIDGLMSKRSHHNSIVWYSHRVLGERLAEHTKVPHFGAGTDASPSKEKVIIASIATQGTGKNLQHYDMNLITTMPPNGKTFEQLVGRTHRPGQKADVVTVKYYNHVPELDEAMNQVISDAKYIQETTGQKQKVLYASMLGKER